MGNQKIFIVAGEVSGDKLGAWYLKRFHNTTALAVGGSHLKEAGATLYARMEDLNVVGVVNIVKKARFLLTFLKQLAAYIIKSKVDEVVLIDFPGFNLRLAKLLKSAQPGLKITYFSPPQLWAWGQWRLRKLKTYTDRIIVLYPFEVAWYAKRGVTVEWLGSPHVEGVSAHFAASEHKTPTIAWLPGSRPGELAEMFTTMVAVIKKFKNLHPNVQVVVPLAESFSGVDMRKRLHEVGLDQTVNVQLIEGKEEKLKALAGCCLALAKPGTSTLELALLKIPTIVMFKTSWVTYLMARPFVKISNMALPNLLLGKPVVKEFIQNECKVDDIVREMSRLYESFVSKDQSYATRLDELDELRTILSGEKRVLSSQKN